MTKAIWKQSEEQTKLSKEVSRLNDLIKDDSYLKEYGGALNPFYYHTLKYSPERYSIIISYDDGYDLDVYCPNYTVWYPFSELSSQVYEHPDGRRFTRIFIYDEKHKVVGSVDIPEHRRE